MCDGTREETDMLKVMDMETGKIYEDEFGVTLSFKESHDRAIEIATYFEIVLEIFEKNPD